ncbi:MAG: hypothetical protein HY762_06595 [Planctomycetes bacterium]|nr:hypothetical protein [Planctomycetota bacterium]
MSILTRVLVVVVLVMSLLYLGLTAALMSYHTDYKNRWSKEQEAHNKTREDKDAEIKKLTDRRDQLDKDLKERDTTIKTMQQALTDAQGELENYKSQLTQLTTEYTKLSETYNKLQQEMEQQTKRNQKLEQEVADFRQKKEDAQKEYATIEQKYLETEDKLLKTEKSLAQLEQQYLVQAKDYNYAKTLLEQYKKITPIIPTVGPPPKLIEGKILAVSDKPELNLVVISVGKNDGVELGMKFTVYRGDKYVGKVQIEKVDQQFASAFSIKEFQADTIKIGDNITTSPY